MTYSNTFSIVIGVPFIFQVMILCDALVPTVPIFLGYLDEQFNQLEELQDESSPNFVEEVVALFLKDSPRLLTNIEQTIGKYPQDFYRLDSLVHQLKGSGSSIGAVRMKNECSVFKAYCNDKNLEGCRRSLQKMKREHATLKQKLESYFQLLRQVGPRERAVNSRT
uniref:Uncharacterized protein n=1 Tax=Avena sativa TaxID=4498 RepID=A0ACD5TQK4_AVESA